VLLFLGQALPYIAASVFIGGMAWRITSWLKTPAPFPITLFPAPASATGRIARISRELVLFASLRRGDQGLWIWAWLMHVSLAMIIVGHIVGIYYLTHQFTMIGFSAAVSTELSESFGTVAGFVFFVTLVVLFYRRTAIPEVKRLSDPADYFELLLLLAIVVTGMHMRVTSLAEEVNLVDIRAYMGGLLTLHPVPFPDQPIFISHFFLVNILLMYFPFSKLVHLAGFFVNRLLLTEPAPHYPADSSTVRSAGVYKGVSKSG
jgi:nitrate reductase gamma subunit